MLLVLKLSQKIANGPCWKLWYCLVPLHQKQWFWFLIL